MSRPRDYTDHDQLQVKLRREQDVEVLPVIFVGHLLGRATESGDKILLLAATDRSCGYGRATMVSKKEPGDGDK